MSGPLNVEIYSDIACPWCYVGERRFARALAALPEGTSVEVVFRPLQLDPTLPETPVPLREHLQDKFGAHLDAVLRQTAATAAADGLTLRFEEAQAVNTFAAHRLLWLAEHEGGSAVQRALAERLFEAHFTHGANVADPVVLEDLAASVGLDRARVRAYLASDEGVDDIRRAMAQATRLGIRAVPTFVFNGQYAVQGAQPTSTFLQVLESLQHEMNAPADADAAPEACADEACAV
ncbi:MAG TPA: DsbA family oxidoreductase [Rhodothermales bacterium]|nr:DsbA family oxidoreductase [Rhodothermales bacterium]